jgi:MFS family permease
LTAITPLIAANQITGISGLFFAPLGDRWGYRIMLLAGLGVLGFAFFASVANDNFFVVYAAWLEEAFYLSIVTLGITTAVIGVAELLGEGLTASLADWMGLRGWRPQVSKQKAE